MKKLVPFILLLLTACQPISLDLTPHVGNGSARLNIRTEMFEYLAFETRAKAVSEVSSRISFAIFDMNGEKVLGTKSQARDEAGFGSLNVNIDPGTYVLVTVAHNGEGNCTISSPTEVKFKDNKLTDTFVSCDTLTVTKGEQTERITLRRRVAMMRLLLEERLPTEVAQIKFYYTGGSSTLDASTGFGSINSRQTEILKVPALAYSETGSKYEVYTFPHEERDTLKLTITALTSAGTSIAEREIVKLPVKMGQITQFRGTLTGSDDTPGLKIELTVDDDEWEQKNYRF